MVPPQEKLSDLLPTAKERREAYGLTQAQAAERLHVSLATFYRWETGRATPGGKRAEDYARFLRKAPIEEEK